MPPSGISAEGRALLDELHRGFRAPFRIAEAVRRLRMGEARTARVLQELQAGGWLARLRPGVYATVPLGSEDPAEWRIDPWVVATCLWQPCYLAGWTALSHWELTEQLFQVTVVVTAQRLRGTAQVVQDARFLVHRLEVGKHFGLRPIWRADVKTHVSDPTRTLIDVLSAPSLGGGIRHVSECLATWFASDHRRDELLLAYALRLGNRAVFKRLGHLIETLELPSPWLIEHCQREMSSGLSPLDPSVNAKGIIRKRWNLRVNVQVYDR